MEKLYKVNKPNDLCSEYDNELFKKLYYFNTNLLRFIRKVQVQNKQKYNDDLIILQD